MSVLPVAQKFSFENASISDRVRDKLVQIENNPKSAAQQPLISHAFLWFNWIGDSQYPIRLSDAVKEQIIEAAYSYVDGSGNPQTRNFSVDHLSISELQTLYRVLRSYQKDKSTGGQKTIFLSLLFRIEKRLQELSQDAQNRQEIMQVLDRENDLHTKFLKYTVFPELVPNDSLNESSWAVVPNEITDKIFRYLDPKSLGRARQVCHIWKEFADNILFHPSSIKEIINLASFFGIRPFIDSAEVSNLYKMEVVYSRFLPVLKAYEIPMISDSHPMILSTETISTAHQRLQAKALIEFCFALPQEVMGTLPSLTNLGLSEIEKAQALRQELKASEAVENLQELNLDSKNIKMLPDEIGLFTSLTILDLSDNQLSSLPKSLGNLLNLQNLRLRNNKLSSLPDGIQHLTQLRSLDVFRNRLTSLPDGIQHLTQLTLLDVSFNQLTSLPDGIQHLTQLTRLGIASNSLTSLPDGIRHLTQLTTLLVFSNRLTSLPDGIQHLTRLTYLDVSDNQLTSLPDWIQHLTQLTLLNVFDNPGLIIPAHFRRPGLEIIS